MSQAPNQSPRQPLELATKLKEGLTWLVGLVKNNWGTKLLSLLLAIGLWAGLISQDPSLTREKVFRGVAVTVSGTDTLKRNGFTVISDLDELLKDVTLKVDVPQTHYADAQALNYTVRLDLSRIRAAGQHEVAITAYNSAVYGDVLSITPSKILVTVEEYANVGFIPVVPVQTGAVPEGFYAANVNCDPAFLTVSGPRSLVEQVKRAEVTVDLSKLPAREGEVRNAADFRLMNEAGEVIENAQLQVTSDSVLRTNVNVTATMYTRRDIDVTKETLYYGKPAAGYEVVGVVVSPESVTIAGEKDKVAIARLFNNRRAANITGAREDVEHVIELGNLPNLAWVGSRQFDVTIQIQPIIETAEFASVPVMVTGLAQGAAAAGVPETASVRVTGAAMWLRELSQDAVQLICDVSGLAPGEHDVPLQCRIGNSDGQDFTVDVEPMSVQVTVSTGSEN